MLRIGWFSTARSETGRRLLRATYDSIRSGELDAEIAFVFCNREPGESPETDLFFEQVQSYGIPLVHLTYEGFRTHHGQGPAMHGGRPSQWRVEYDRQVMECLEDYQMDLGVLAGYMLITSDEMCQRYDLINLHPAAPNGPTGMWQQVIWRLIETRAKESGVFMHLVTPELDRGPIVTYCTFSLRGGPFDPLWHELGDSPVEEIQARYGEEFPLFQIIRRYGAARETPLILATLKAFSRGKVRIRLKVVVDGDGNPISGYNLSKEIDSVAQV
ncbi:MAG: phosphoribosylglycinamide formyltransferase [Dehalococcoidia bacterium]|nr:phosphoribosylglycinamide formyltransferase [Dehalococcoidia bacterium]